MTAAPHPGKRRLLGAREPLLTVLVVGLVARAVLIPMTHGPDFTVWDLASKATLNGVNVYAHHPAYGGGPYAYFPLFLYVELPMQWLSVHTGVPFTILGKLPIAGADLVVTVLLVREIRRRGLDRRSQAVAAALFFLNPLVVYNGAFYGRFDSVAVALLVLALSGLRSRRPGSWGASVTYACAVAMKTFPGFVLPWVLRRDRITAARAVVACAVVLAAVAAPYLLTSPRAFTTDLLYSADKLSGGLSWQVILHGLPASIQIDIGAVLLGAFVAGAVALGFVEDDTLCAAATLVLFLILSKQVIEQYLIWPLPFLVMLAVHRRSRPAWLLIAELTVAGALVNAYIHPFGLQPPVMNLVFAGAVSLTVIRMVATELASPGRKRSLAAPAGRCGSPSTKTTAGGSGGPPPRA